jgi:hypothetical protein
MRIVSGAVILLTLGVLVFLSTQGIWSIEKSWPILIIVFAAVTLVQSPRDLGGWVIGAAGLLFLFFKNWFGQIRTCHEPAHVGDSHRRGLSAVQGMKKKES